MISKIKEEENQDKKALWMLIGAEILELEQIEKNWENLSVFVWFCFDKSSDKIKKVKSFVD